MGWKRIGMKKKKHFSNQTSEIQIKVIQIVRITC